MWKCVDGPYWLSKVYKVNGIIYRIIFVPLVQIIHKKQH